MVSYGYVSYTKKKSQSSGALGLDYGQELLQIIMTVQEYST